MREKQIIIAKFKETMNADGMSIEQKMEEFAKLVDTDEKKKFTVLLMKYWIKTYGVEGENKKSNKDNVIELYPE